MSQPSPDVTSTSKPDDPVLTVSLSRSAWVALVTSLGQRPYTEVAEMIEEIAGQLREQIVPHESAAAESATERSH